MFKGFSAWFAPELRSYKQTWVNHGGEVKELADADIAFVTDNTSSAESSYRPTMKILRPDWIEDSIRGHKRLSLKRYKSVFPGLARFDSTEHGNMAIGMDAFNSTNVISLDKSWQPHQPEPEIQDLSVTPSSGTTSHKSHPSLGSIGGTRISSPFQQNRSVSVTAGTVQTITLTRSDPDKVGDVSEDEDDIAVRDELEDDSEVASPAFLEHPSRSSSKEYKPLEQDLSSDSMEDAGFREDSTPSEPKSAPPEAISLAPTRKRRLPQTLLKPHRPPAQTHDSQVSDDFFASSDDELAVSETNSLKKKRSPERNTSQGNLDRADTIPLSPRDSLPPASFHECEDNKISYNAGERSASHQETHRIRAEDYLRDTLARLDEESKQLLSTLPIGVRLIDIERDNVDLRRKKL